MGVTFKSCQALAHAKSWCVHPVSALKEDMHTQLGQRNEAETFRITSMLLTTPFLMYLFCCDVLDPVSARVLMNDFTFSGFICVD